MGLVGLSQLHTFSSDLLFVAMAFFLYLLFFLDALGNSEEQRCSSRLGFYHTSLVLTAKFMTII